MRIKHWLMVLFLSITILQLAQARKYVAPSGSNDNNGDTWITAYADVQKAIDEVSGDMEVWIAEGEYVGKAELRSGVKLYGGFAEGATDLAQRDPAARVTTLDGNNTLHTVKMDNLTTCTLDGLRITGGRATSGTSWDSLGGACFAAIATPPTPSSIAPSPATAPRTMAAAC